MSRDVTMIHARLEGYINSLFYRCISLRALTFIIVVVRVLYQDPGIYAWSLDLRIQFFVRTGVAIFVRISPRFPKISKKLSGFST